MEGRVWRNHVLPFWQGQTLCIVYARSSCISLTFRNHCISLLFTFILGSSWMKQHHYSLVDSALSGAPLGWYSIIYRSVDHRYSEFISNYCEALQVNSQTMYTIYLCVCMYRIIYSSCCFYIIADIQIRYNSKHWKKSLHSWHHLRIPGIHYTTWLPTTNPIRRLPTSPSIIPCRLGSADRTT